MSKKDGPQSNWQTNNIRQQRGLTSQESERDACALIALIRKEGHASHGNVKRAIDGLTKMGHRTGIVNGEGDGVGLMTDIPRELWARYLAQHGIRGSLAADNRFWVGHIMIPKSHIDDAEHLKNVISNELLNNGFEILLERNANVNRRALGPQGRNNEPLFWQIAGLAIPQIPLNEIDSHLFRAQMGLERITPVHFASLSAHNVVYKVQGAVEVLPRYYPELRHPDYCSSITIGHARYSTNTQSSFERVQPFSVLGHNGEFNTIGRLRQEARQIGVQFVEGGSDSQDIDRLLLTLCLKHGFDIAEAMEIVFPPIDSELQTFSEDVQAVYRHNRAAFGPFAQGPAALATRIGDLCVFSVDALGLRPLWYGETEKEYFFSSERGVIPVDTMSADPKPLAPGEKMAARVERGRNVYVHEYPAIRQHVVERARERGRWLNDDNWRFGNPLIWSMPVGEERPWPAPRRPFEPEFTPETANIGTSSEILAETETNNQLTMAVAAKTHQTHPTLNQVILSALGWDREDVEYVETLTTGKELIGSLGYDGQLAVLADKRVNLADYFKETVSVVTNPAIDREREQEHFSTKVLLGTRPSLTEKVEDDHQLVTLEIPILLGGHTDFTDIEAMRGIAFQNGTLLYEDVRSAFGDKAYVLHFGALDDETIENALYRLQAEAVDAVMHGAQCLMLDDAAIVDGTLRWIDPILVTAAIDNILVTTQNGTSYRRKAGLVLRSGALRNLHDLVLAIGMGANAVNPYALLAVASDQYDKQKRRVKGQEEEETDPYEMLNNSLHALTKGLEKVIATIGCHEIRGYGRVVSSVGLPEVLEPYFQTDNFCWDVKGWQGLEDTANERAQLFRGEGAAKYNRTTRVYPKFYRLGGKVAREEAGFTDWLEHIDDIEAKTPVALRHLIDFKPPQTTSTLSPEDVDVSLGHHRMPTLISAMSFGSQGEISFRAFAEGAQRMNIICMNGEGGELEDMMGKYRHNRGQQVASGRFGVNVELLNSCDYIEIKIGQGAKPGEGGQLPGFKVTEQIAYTRHTPSGIPLISPNNNHDIYSIEDLAQIVEELKTVNPLAKISVKIPVVPGIGIIAVGVAKSGADIINLTGFEGGTGAARAHALQHVGLPVEIGVALAHHGLVKSGIRHRVELWCDGGIKSGKDVLRMIALGADRVGFGTMAMVAIGCTICRSCETGTCHVGITSHIKSAAEALQHGQKNFEPRIYDRAVDGLVRFFETIEQELKMRLAVLGIAKITDLVGRADLLEQISGHDKVDVSALLVPAPDVPRMIYEEGIGRQVGRPRNFLTQLVTNSIYQAINEGDEEVSYNDEFVMAHDRAMGTHLAGELERQRCTGMPVKAVHLNFTSSALPGNGLAAFNDAPIDIVVEGGAQDGVAKSMRGGKVMIMKGINHDGVRVDGSVGKSFAYGAQGGTIIVQGNADSRACIRLSGADVVFGGEITSALNDKLGNLGSRANLKGFACEYMTSGRVLIMGDPGPWMCAGMTGGVIYQRLQPDLNLDIEALEHRLAGSAQVEILNIDEDDIEGVRYLLNEYFDALTQTDQAQVVNRLSFLTISPKQHFVKIVPMYH